MMKMRLTIIFSAIFLLVCCSSNYIVELQNGYKIWFMSATKVYIGNQDDSLVVGPNVEGINTKNHYIVGMVNNSGQSYFVIDTIKNIIKKDMSKVVWQAELEAIGLTKDLRLISPTTNYKVHHN